MSPRTLLIVLRLPVFVLGCLITTQSRADTFGIGANAFTIDFVNIGNPGSPGDWGPPTGGRQYTSGFGYVPYTYRMAVTEVPQVWIDKATNLGMANVTAGAWTGTKPAANMTWYEAAAFVNWLNTSTGRHAAYDLAWTGAAWTMNLWSAAQAWDNDPGPATNLDLYRHKDALYYLPSQDEWCKAAFNQNAGPLSGFYDYATGSNTLPTPVVSGIASGTAVYSIGAGPAAVNDDGGLSPFGTRGQNGNVWEWLETADDNSNNIPDEYRVFRGGGFGTSASSINSGTWQAFFPAYSQPDIGFRVASATSVIPEPTASLLVLSVAVMSLYRRRRAGRR